jgi:hypothetical protein
MRASHDGDDVYGGAYANRIRLNEELRWVCDQMNRGERLPNLPPASFTFMPSTRTVVQSASPP